MLTDNSGSQRFLMPAEWEEHRATWLAWPALESDFPGKLGTVQWVYTELVRHLSQHERVEILCKNEFVLERAKEQLRFAAVKGDYALHSAPYHRTWLRDSAGTVVRGENGLLWMKWHFNAWAKYDDVQEDSTVSEQIADLSDLPIIPALRPNTDEPLVLEGGAIEVNGKGSILVTEQCLLSTVQSRNPGMTRSEYELAFKTYLGAENVVWLSGSCEGDDTHGHIDDAARFVSPTQIVAAGCKEGESDFQTFEENYERLLSARDEAGGKFEVIKLPTPEALYFRDGEQLLRLPASYANFYIANGMVLVPTFNDPQDRQALGLLSELFPGRKVLGIHAVDFVLGFGTIHCSTQQEPAR